MMNKRVILVVLGAFFVTSPLFSAVSTTEIDKIRDKPVLGEKDFQIIDKFVTEAIQDLITTRNFASIASKRRVVLTYSKSAVAGQAQYAEKFSESAYKYVSEALQGSSGLPEENRFKVILNLLILVDNLEDLRLVNLGRGMLNHDNTVIRYWAVHSITNPGIIRQLNSNANSKLASEIAVQLKQLVEGTSSETIALMAEFAAKVNVQEGEDLLGQIADVRIKKYIAWTVKDALLDATILKLLYDKISSAEANRSTFARYFGQLYSCAMQRYIKGRYFLNEVEKQQLASVLVEIEQACVGKILGKSQSDIRRVLGREDYARLSQEYINLFGDEASPGPLTLKLNCDYGRKDDGTKRVVPLILPEPPKRASAEIKTEE